MEKHMATPLQSVLHTSVIYHNSEHLTYIAGRLLEQAWLVDHVVLDGLAMSD